MSSTYDIDTYLNRITPPNPLHHLPRPVSHFLGHRPVHSAPRKHPIPLIWAFSFLGAFLGVALIEAVYIHLPLLSSHRVPVVIASFGAAAILEYNTIESPLSQPRNLVVGHVLAAVIGVGITKLFLLLPNARFEALRWLAGALAVGTASVVMSMTKTVHPPAGATALLTATSAEITELGWWTVALVLLGCMLMLTSALILNNIIRQFPMYWWTPEDLRSLQPEQKQQKQKQLDIENGRSDDEEDQVVEKVGTLSETGSDTLRDSQDGLDGTRIHSGFSRVGTSRIEMAREHEHEHEITISNTKVAIPTWLELSDFEIRVLQILRERLREGPA